MKDWLLEILEAGLKGPLNDNRLANRLYDDVVSRRFYSVSRAEICNGLLSGQTRKKKEFSATLNLVDNSAIKDCRFKTLVLSNFKRYPIPANCNRFGISFSGKVNGNNNLMPLCCVFLGSNGVGKTSLYAALEYVSMRYMNSAAIRGYTRKVGQNVHVKSMPEQSQLAFMTHVNSNPENIRISLDTMDSRIDINGVDTSKPTEPPLVCEAFFCSDSDVRELESCRDYSEFLLRQLGLKEIDNCLQVLYYTWYYFYKKRSEYEIFSIMKGGIPKNAYKILIERLLYAIAMGIVSLPEDDYEHYDKGDLTSGLSPNNESNSAERNIKLNEIIKILRNEIKSFPPKIWLTKGIRNEYVKAFQFLKRMKQHSNDCNSKEYVNLYLLLSEFSSFRKTLFDRLRIFELSINEIEMETDKNERISKRNELILETEKNISNIIQEGIDDETQEKEYPLAITNAKSSTRFSNELKQLIVYVESELEKLLKEWESSLTETIDNLLNEYFESDNDCIKTSLCFKQFQGDQDINIVSEGIKEKGTIHNFVRFDIEIESAGGILNTIRRKDTELRSYINTFKYKLFCVALKLAMNCVAKGIYRLEYPFVIDDVFDSSDFDSRVGLREFISNIITCHDKIMHSRGFEKPLQLIFFTQDDLIADQVASGIRDCGNLVKFSRIYDYHEASDDDIKHWPFDINEDNRYCSLEDIIS